MSVFMYEMKQNRKSIMAWSITMALVAFLLLSATPLFIEESSGMRDTMAAFPDAVKEAFGIDLDLFFSAVGFYSYIFLYIGLAASIQAMSLGLEIISKENRMKTADFLLSKPKSRAAIFWQKLLAALCGLAITEAAFFIAVTLSMIYQTGGDFAVTAFVLISFTYSIIQMVFFALGVFLAVVISKIKSTISVTMGVCFGMFLMGMISVIVDSEVLRYLSPLKYFDNNYIMLHNVYETPYLAASIALVVVLIAASFMIYNKKDIHAAI